MYTDMALTEMDGKSCQLSDALHSAGALDILQRLTALLLQTMLPLLVMHLTPYP